MPRITRVISARVAIKKFFLRELIIFLMDERGKVVGDDNLEFSVGDFKTYIAKRGFKTAVGDITNERIREHLRVLQRSFYARDENLETINPPKPLIASFANPQGSDCFKIKKCFTEYLGNALRYIDISLYLQKPLDERGDAGETTGEYTGCNANSMFGTTQDHKLTFLDNRSDRPLGLKERAIFLHLRNKYKENCGYEELFEKIKSLRVPTNRYTSASEKKDFVNNGIMELRKKICDISGHPNAIVTKKLDRRDRTAAYKLIY